MSQAFSQEPGTDLADGIDEDRGAAEDVDQTDGVDVVDQTHDVEVSDDQNDDDQSDDAEDADAEDADIEDADIEAPENERGPVPGGAPSPGADDGGAPETGDLVIDAALRDLAQAPVDDLDAQIERGEQVQRTLQGRLSDLGG